MKGDTFTDLHGNIFSLGDWELASQIPIGEFDHIYYTGNANKFEPFNLCVKGNNYYAYIYNIQYHLFIRYNLKLKGYDESKDIRKSYLYERNRSKIPKTNGNNRHHGRVS